MIILCFRVINVTTKVQEDLKMERKEIVKILGEHFGVKPRYLGVPSCAYQIKAEGGEEFIIDREGKIKNSEGIEFEFERLINGPGEEPLKEEITAKDISFPIDGHTGVTLRNLVNMISSKQSLIKKALGIEKDIVTAEFVEAINNVSLATIEDFKIVADEIGIEKIPGLEFNFEKRVLTFGFIKTFEDRKIANLFAKALNESALKLKQSSPKPTETDNEKFTFRTWLMRLGFVGADYKKAREVMLRDLQGNGAFRKGKPQAEH